MQNGYLGSYDTHQRGTETIRETDAHALLSCASRLEVARRPDCPQQIYIDAIKHNQRLWTVFQVCVTEKDNPLPDAIKIALFNLSRYVDKVSFRAIVKRDPDALLSLVNINRQIAAGLSAGQKSVSPPPEPPKPPENFVPGSITTTA